MPSPAFDHQVLEEGKRLTAICVYPSSMTKDNVPLERSSSDTFCFQMFQVGAKLMNNGEVIDDSPPESCDHEI